MGTLEVVNISS